MSNSIRLARLTFAVFLGAITGFALWWLFAADPGIRDELLRSAPQLFESEPIAPVRIDQPEPAPTFPAPQGVQPDPPPLSEELAALIQRQAELSRAADQLLRSEYDAVLDDLDEGEGLADSLERDAEATGEAENKDDDTTVAEDSDLSPAQRISRSSAVLRNRVLEQMAQGQIETNEIIDLLGNLEQEISHSSVPNTVINFDALRGMLRASDRIQEITARLNAEAAKGEHADHALVQQYTEQLQALQPALMRPTINYDALDAVIYDTD